MKFPSISPSSLPCGFCVAASLLILTGAPLSAQTTTANAPTNAPAANAVPLPPDVSQALGMPDGPDQLKALGAAARAWAQNDPYGYATWAVTLPQKSFDAVRGAASGCGQSAAPQNAANWLASQNLDRAKGLLHVMLIRWAMTAPAAAEAWCATPGLSRDVRYLAYFTVGDGLCRKGPAPATAWAAQLPPGDDHLAAIHGIALIWARGDITAATAWIKQLNPQDMKRAAQAVAETWGQLKGKGGPTLEGWLDQLSLSATDKEEVLKGPRPDEYNFSKYQPAPSSAH